MIKEIEIILKPRLHLLDHIKSLTTEQLNKVPAGFNNNIAWNLAHLISAQQGVCYKRAGVDIVIEDRFFSPYRPDTKPERFIEAEEIDEIKALFLSTLEKLDADVKNNVFAGYTPWITRYGVELNNIDEAVKFLPFHDGIHTGYIWALKRVL